MKKAHLRRQLLQLLLLALLSFEWATAATQEVAEDNHIRIAVLAHRGIDVALSQWTPLAQYLTEQIPGYDFTIVPVTLDTIDREVAQYKAHFVLTNPGSYANLEHAYGITRIATVRKRNSDGEGTQFGATIFTKASRSDIRTLADLRDKSFIAVHRDAFGGWLMALRELRDVGIDPEHDFSSLEFSDFPQDKVVFAVLSGKVDAGTVRTGILEQLAKQRKIRLEDVRIINPQRDSNFPFLHSTRLYPEWPFSISWHTSQELGQKVATALLSLSPDHPASNAARIDGWTIPLDYNQVHGLMRELGVGVYKEGTELTWESLLTKYRHWVVSAAAILIVLLLATLGMWRMNLQLKGSKRSLEREVENRRRAMDLIDKQAQRMRAIYDVASMSGTATRDAQLQAILEVGCQLLELDFARVSKIDVENGTLTICNILATSEHRLKPGAIIPLERTYCQVVANTGKAVAISHAAKSEWADSEAYHYNKLESYIAAPIVVHDTPFGNISFACSQQRETPFSEMDIDLVRLMGRLAGVTLERHSVLEELEMAKLGADKANRAKSEFLANMSHEIRTPMNAILGYAQILSRDATLSADQRQAVETITRSGNHLLSLINEILDISKIEAGRMQVHLSDFDLVQLIEDLSRMFQHRCNEKNLQWESTILNSPAHFYVRSDDGKLRQVLINLIGNAVKFTENGGVKLRVYRDSETMFRFEVIDTGPGIPPESIATVFDAFMQERQGVKKGGTGLGLTISSKQIELLGGKLRVESQVGAGSRFYFSIPMKVVDLAALETQNQYGDLAHISLRQPMRALVVDDIEVNRDLLRQFLAQMGFEVDAVNDGDAALPQAIARKPNIVFMDYRMPKMNGADATRALRWHFGSTLPIVMVTASVMEHQEVMFAECGADATVKKPFTFEAIAKVLIDLLGEDKFKLTYAATDPAASAETRDDVDTLPETKIAPNLLEEIEDLAGCGLVNDLDEKLQELRAIHAGLAGKLQTLASAYKLDDIVTLVQKLRKSG